MTNYFRAVYYLYGMMKRAYWNRDRLIRYQNKKLRKIVKHAYDHVPFYHAKLRETGIKPDDIKTAKDLNKLPIVRKDEIKKHIHETISQDLKIDNLRMLRTSGSTGLPLHFYISGAEDEFRKAKHLRANISLGQKPRDKWVVITSPAHFGETTRIQRMLGVYVPTPVLVFDDVAAQISTIEELKPDILDGYSSSLLLLAKEVEKRGGARIRPRFIIGGAELIDDSSRRFIEKVFDAPFYDQYACVEMERLAWQCPEKTGYHMDADTVIVQFVDEDGEEVSVGERGEIVCTSLFNYAMPFIRYAVGDVGIPTNEECPCGRTLPLMKVVEGRKDSFLLLSNGQVLSPIALDVAMNMFKFHSDIDHYRIIQRKIDLFEFYIKIHSGGVAEKTMEKELLKHLWRTLNINVDEATFKVKFVENIPLDKTGKLRKVISELNQNVE